MLALWHHCGYVVSLMVPGMATNVSSKSSPASCATSRSRSSTHPICGEYLRTGSRGHHMACGHLSDELAWRAHMQRPATPADQVRVRWQTHASVLQGPPDRLKQCGRGTTGFTGGYNTVRDAAQAARGERLTLSGARPSKLAQRCPGCKARGVARVVTHVAPGAPSRDRMTLLMY